MTTIAVPIQRTGFPVMIGELEIWFDTSQENLLRFFDFEAEAKKRLTELEKSVVEANLDQEDEGVSKAVAEKALSLDKAYLEIQYDLIFGNGTFEKLYALYPDQEALKNTFDIVARLVAEKLAELAIEREAVVKERKARYINKVSKVKKQSQKIEEE